MLEHMPIHFAGHTARWWTALRESASISLTAAALVMTASCAGGPAPVRPPAIDASEAGELAIDEYDTSGDGAVSGQELEAAPGLKAALSRLDTNGDKRVSAEEVTARIEHWQATGMGLTSFGFTVTLDGRPLEGASVTLEPEAFLGDDIRSAVATTDMFGTAGPSVPKEQRPTAATPPGVQLGLYRVKISKLVGGNETVPARYNTHTTLGQEVSPDVPEIANRRVVYALKSK
jgi:hypothetical protein